MRSSWHCNPYSLVGHRSSGGYAPVERYLAFVARASTNGGGGAILAAMMNLQFKGKIWFWKGPAPWYFVTVPDKQARDLKAVSGFVTYGWGMIPVTVRIGKTEWTTSLWPKDGSYIVPLKASVRNAEKLKEGDEVTIDLRV